MFERCPFCQIINREKEAYIVYEDEKCMAFLDAYPATEGHTLVIPKEHYENIYEISEDCLAHLIRICKRLALDYKRIFQTIGLNIIQSNGIAAKQTIFHFHIHLVPRYEQDGLSLFRHHFPRSENNLLQTYHKIINFPKEIK